MHFFRFYVLQINEQIWNVGLNFELRFENKIESKSMGGEWFMENWDAILRLVISLEIKCFSYGIWKLDLVDLLKFWRGWLGDFEILESSKIWERFDMVSFGIGDNLWQMVKKMEKKGFNERLIASIKYE